MICIEKNDNSGIDGKVDYGILPFYLILYQGINWMRERIYILFISHEKLWVEMVKM